MIYIIHGDDPVISRNLILRLRRELNVSEYTEVSVANIEPSYLLSLCSSNDMFGYPAFVIFDISEAGRRNLDHYVKSSVLIPDDANLVIYSSKELSKNNAFLSSVRDLRAKVFSSKKIKDSNIFKFLDFIFNGDRKGSYSELRKMFLSGEDPFYIFSMILYQLRMVTLAKFSSPLYAKMSPFVKSKAQAQSQIFSEENIKEIYQRFYELDKDVKTGNISVDLLVPMATEKVLSFFKR